MIRAVVETMHMPSWYVVETLRLGLNQLNVSTRSILIGNFAQITVGVLGIQEEGNPTIGKVEPLIVVIMEVRKRTRTRRNQRFGHGVRVAGVKTGACKCELLTRRTNDQLRFRARCVVRERNSDCLSESSGWRGQKTTNHQTDTNNLDQKTTKGGEHRFKGKRNSDVNNSVSSRLQSARESG